MWLEKRGECLARSMEPSFYRPGGRAQDRGRLFGADLLNVAEKQNCAVVVGQHVDAAADKPSSFVAQQLFIGRLLPPTDALRMVARFVKRRQQRVDRNLGLVGARSQLHEADVDDDSMQPGAKG